MKLFSKKVVALALTIIMVLGTFVITANAATSYSTGTYTISANNGSNVRSGAGTNYSKVGAASKGTTFTVSKISGSWGYTSGIKCTNGTRSGWVCLDYAKQTSRNTYNDVFASLKGSGYSLSQARSSSATTFTKGDYVYVWAWVHDSANNLYKSYSSGTCNMTISIYRPNGTCAHTYTYKNSDNNWIGTKLDTAGTWKIQSKISGSISGTNTTSITVKDTSTTKYYTLTYNANGGSGAPSSQTVAASTYFNLSSTKPTRSGYTFLGWSTSKTATSASYSPGASVKISGNITLYAVWKVNTTSTKYYTLTYNANGGSGAPSSQTVAASTYFNLSSTKPTRSGYTFLGWSTSKTATSASYSPGASVKISGNITLYAVWKVNTTYTGYVNTGSASLCLRQSASTSSSVLAYMPKGSSLTVLDNKAQTNGFYHVTYNGKTGYASASYITFTKPDSSGFLSSSEIDNAASKYGISKSSNAYYALQSINTKYSSMLTTTQKNGVLVFMFEGVGNSSKSSERMNAMCVVIKNNKIVYLNRNSSTIPDYPFKPNKNGGTDMPTLKSGIYSFSTVNHKGSYAALNVNNANVVRFNSKSSFYSSTSYAINVHRRSTDSIAPSNKSWVNSAGCLLIGKSGTSSSGEYAKFIQAVGIVYSSSSGNTTYKYSVNGTIVVDRTYASSYLSSIGYSSSAIKAIG